MTEQNITQGNPAEVETTVAVTAEPAVETTAATEKVVEGAPFVTPEAGGEPAAQPPVNGGEPVENLTPQQPKVKLFDIDLPVEPAQLAEVDQLKSKVQELESLIQDPFISNYINAKNSGKPFEEFVKDVASVNYDAMRTQDPERLYKEFLKSEYPEQANNEEWLSDEYVAFLDGREAPTTRAQIDELRNISKKLSEKKPSAIGYEVDPLQGKKIQEAVVNNFNAVRESLVGKRLLSDNGEGGIEFTEQHYKRGQAVIDYWAKHSVKDGAPTPEFLKFMVLAANMEDLLGHAINSSANAGKAEVLREKANLAPTAQTAVRVPAGLTTRSNSSDKDAVIQREREHLKKQREQNKQK